MRRATRVEISALIDELNRGFGTNLTEKDALTLSHFEE